MDEKQLEVAEAHYERLRELRIEKERAKVPTGIGPEECDCGDLIPLKRRQMGYRKCVECATRMERKM